MVEVEQQARALAPGNFAERTTREVARVDVETDHATSLILLHDPGHSFDERTLREQFGV